MSGMRIYIAPETFLPLVGGSERQAFFHSKYLRAQGIEATVITLHFQRDVPAYEYREGVPIIRVAGSVLAWHGRWTGYPRRCCYLLALFILGWQLWRLRHAYDMVHVFQLSFFTWPALIACRLTGKPLIVAMRCDAPSLEAKTRSGSSAEQDGLARLGKPMIQLLARQLYSAHACIIVLSTHMRESLVRHGFARTAIHLIPNGVDTLAFTPGETEQALTVVCVAKFRYQKGLDVLLHAWRLLTEELPEARLVLVGDGPLLASLQALAEELTITASVEFVGLCADVARQYQRGSVAVLPSRWEGMPNALLEAMACGRACVATRVSGSQDILWGEEHGLLVEPEDQESLAAALWLLLTEPELARRYGQLARRHVEQSYTFEQSMQRSIELYRALLQPACRVESVAPGMVGMH